MLRKLLIACSALLPWALRRRLLTAFLGYRIHPTARMGLCYTAPRELIMEEGSRIGHMTVCINLDLVHLKAHASIGKGNWITGFPTGASRHFAHQPERRSELIIGEHAAITNRHLIDCTGGVTIGRFTTMAGFHSQILTHSIDIVENRQSAQPVRIGEYCFLGTNCVLLGGSALPNRSVLGAKSLLNKAFEQEQTLYGGCPAKAISQLPAETKYFNRETGYID